MEELLTTAFQSGNATAILSGVIVYLIVFLQRKNTAATRDDTISKLKEDIDNLNNQNAEQQAVIRNQDVELNTVYYFVAPMETLVERGLANKGGLFSKSTASNEIDKSMMVAADKRELKLIALNTTKATILTNHPESSYQITKGDDGMLSLNILNADAFWNTSNYLIISIK